MLKTIKGDANMICDGEFAIESNAHVIHAINCVITMKDDSRIDVVHGNSVIKSMSDNAFVGMLKDVSRVEIMQGRSIVEKMRDRSVVVEMKDESHVERCCEQNIDNNPVIEVMRDKSSVSEAWGHTRIYVAMNKAYIKEILDNVKVYVLRDNAKIDQIFINGEVVCLTDNASVAETYNQAIINGQRYNYKKEDKIKPLPL